MKKKNIYVLFDDMVNDFINYRGEMCEEELVEEMKKYLKHLSKTSKIMVITHDDVIKIKKWFEKNDLFKFVDNISNPVQYFAMLNNPCFFDVD